MILVCGEALVDLLVTAQSGSRALAARFGGAPYNVAVGLARLDVPAAFLGGLSADPVGQALLASLKHEGVETTLVRVSDAPSMIALAGVGATGAASYSFPVADGADKRLPPAEAVLAGTSEFSAAVFGSFLAFHPQTSAQLLALARGLGRHAVICLDPNVRLALLPDPAQWRAGLEAFLPYTDILKISDEDIACIYGADAAPDVLAGQWLSRGAAAVFVTRGEKGASLFMRDAAEYAVPAPKVPVADTVGAGDSFLAGLLAHLHHAGALRKDGLRNEAHLRRATEYAVAAAAITCQRPGADLPRLCDMQRRQDLL